MKNSIVKSIQPNGTWEGKYGLMYKFEIGFENGDVGEYSSKNKDQDKFNIGSKTDYEYIDGKFPKVKPVYMKPDSFNQSSPKQDVNVNNSIARAVAFKGAIDYDNQCTQEDVIKNAKYFYDNWLCDNNVVQKKVDKVDNPNQYASAFDAKFKGSTPDDLPF